MPVKKIVEKAAAEAALKELFSKYENGPMSNSVWLGHGYIEAYTHNSKIALAGIFVVPECRHKGFGSTYMRLLCEIADKHSVSIECLVDPFGAIGGNQLGARQLRAWYLKHGFSSIPHKPLSMERKAKPRNS